MPRINKREFLRASSCAGLGWLLGDSVWARFADLPARQLAEHEDFWVTIRAKYRLKPDYINLESGYYSMQADARARGVHREGPRGELRGVLLPAHDAGARQGRGARHARRDGRLLARRARASRATRPSRSTPSSTASTGSRATKR